MVLDDMKERPILFSSPMVRAILEGRKTQTRRVVNFGKNAISPNGPYIEDGPPGSLKHAIHEGQKISTRAACLYGVPGDRLWVKEGWRPRIAHSCAMNTCDCGDVSIKYMADGEERYFPDGSMPDEWTMPKAASKHSVTCLFMPRWASRITLEITDVRIQRVQEISEEDAKAEGLRIHENPNCSLGCGRYMYTAFPGAHSLWELDARTAFKNLWDSINGKKHPWSSNPCVWALTFRRVQ